MQKKEKHDTCVWGQVALSGSIIAVGNTIQIWACKINGDHMLHHFELVCFFFLIPWMGWATCLILLSFINFTMWSAEYLLMNNCLNLVINNCLNNLMLIFPISCSPPFCTMLSFMFVLLYVLCITAFHFLASLVFPNMFCLVAHGLQTQLYLTFALWNLNHIVESPLPLVLQRMIQVTFFLLLDLISNYTMVLPLPWPLHTILWFLFYLFIYQSSIFSVQMKRHNELLTREHLAIVWACDYVRQKNEKGIEY